MYKEKIDEIKKDGKNEYSWIDYKIKDLNEKYLYVNILSKTVLSALDCEDYEIAQKLNELVKDKFDEDVFEQAKISKNKKLSENEKQLLHCIHNGIVSKDELIALNNFDLYEKTIKAYPISKFEILYNAIINKDYKLVFDTAQSFGFSILIEDLRNKKEDKLIADFVIKLYNQDLSNEINYNYLKKFINKEVKTKTQFLLPLYEGKPNYKYEGFSLAKQIIFLNQVLDKDVRFIELGCSAATQQELDYALTKIQPNNFKAINILLNFGAKLHKKSIEDDGWGYMVNRDEIDEIGTELLKQKIKDILGER